MAPTRMKGTPGAWCLISGNHLFLMLSKEDGEATE